MTQRAGIPDKTAARWHERAIYRVQRHPNRDRALWANVARIQGRLK